jgi:hypothetical protein
MNRISGKSRVPLDGACQMLQGKARQGKALDVRNAQLAMRPVEQATVRCGYICPFFISFDLKRLNSEHSTTMANGTFFGHSVNSRDLVPSAYEIPFFTKGAIPSQLVCAKYQKKKTKTRVCARTNRYPSCYNRGSSWCVGSSMNKILQLNEKRKKKEKRMAHTAIQG